ncbi:hypothetical protein Tco_0322745 [Tanacetum coccineum]
MANNLPLRGGHNTYGFTSCDVLNLGAFLDILVFSLNFILNVEIFKSLSLNPYAALRFLARSVRSSNAIALDSPYLPVLITGTSQSRHHFDTCLIHIESYKSPTAELFDIDSGRISIHPSLLEVVRVLLSLALEDDPWSTDSHVGTVDRISLTSYEVFGISAACEDEFVGVGAVSAVVVDAVGV